MSTNLAAKRTMLEAHEFATMSDHIDLMRTILNHPVVLDAITRDCVSDTESRDERLAHLTFDVTEGMHLDMLPSFHDYLDIFIELARCETDLLDEFNNRATIADRMQHSLMYFRINTDLTHARAIMMCTFKESWGTNDHDLRMMRLCTVLSLLATAAHIHGLDNAMAHLDR